MVKTSKTREISCTYVVVFIIASAISAYVGFIIGLHQGEHLVPNHQLNLNNFHDNTLGNEKIDNEEKSESTYIQSKDNEEVKVSIPNTKCIETSSISPCPVCAPLPEIIEKKCPEVTTNNCPKQPKCPTCPLNKGQSTSSKSNLEGTKWSSIENLNSYAMHELLIPNFPPRKDNNPKKGLLLTHGNPRQEYQHGIIDHNIQQNHNKFNFADLTSSLEERDLVSKDLSSCDEVNIVITKGDGRVCLAVLESYDAPPYHVFRMRRKDKGWIHSARYENNAGRMPSIPGIYETPPVFTISVSLLLFTYELIPTPYPPPTYQDNLDGPSMKKMGTNASALLNNFMENRPRIDNELKPLLEKLSSSYGKKKGPIVLLAVNAGVLDLVLNFICSVRRIQAGGVGEYGDILKSILVFAADEEVEVALKQLGVATYRHHALGSFPTASATGYGDDVFTSMMWLKVVSVYTVLRLGFDVLFQDADVIWWRDPRPYFTDTEHTNGQQYDAYFQNDGARSQRYSPFSANSGFYYLRSTPKARFLMHDLIHQYNLISQWHSHQHVLCQLLVEHYTKTGLNVQILPHRFFSIGQQYHRKKDFMLGLKENTMKPFPYIFHWSWTAGKSEKLKYSIETGMWYLKSKCNEKAIRSHLKDDIEYLDTCCRMPTGEKNEHPYLYDSPLSDNLTLPVV